MLNQSLKFIVYILAITSANTVPKNAQQPPQVIAVLKPEQIPAIQRQKLALDQFVFPTENSTCADQVNVLLTMARSCLGNVSMSTQTSSNQFFCQDRLGCRETLRAPIRNVALACKPDDRLRAGAIQTVNQILYTTQMACPETIESCDAQAALVNDMMLINSDQAEFRNLACTSCVKKSFGRMSLRNGSSNHPEIYAKTQCNKINDKYCIQSHEPLPKRICEPCYQRSVAKKLSLDRLQGVKSDSDLLLRACYDDGNGNACINRVVDDLMKSNNISNIPDATFDNYATLQPCRRANACANPQCRSALESLVHRAGCCASAIPVALLGGENLSCLRSMIEQKPACNEPFTYMVSITLRSPDSFENLCRLIREDLATTLATSSDLITCQKHVSALDSPDKEIKTILAHVKRYRSIGMPATIRFDPDLLQCPILDVSTSAVA